MSLELLLAPVTEYNTVSKPHSLKDPRFIQEQLYSPNEDATLVKPKKYNPVARVINRLPVYQSVFKPKRTTDTNAFRTAFREQFALKQEAPTFIGWSEEDKFRWLINATTRQLESVRPENYFGLRLQKLTTPIKIDGVSIEYIAYDFDYREKIYIAYKASSGVLTPKPGVSREPIDPVSLKTIWLDKLTYVPVPRSSLNRNLYNIPINHAEKRLQALKDADEQFKKRELEEEIENALNKPGQPLPDQPMPDQPMPDQPMPGQSVPDQPMPDQPMPGQQEPGQQESDQGPVIEEIDGGKSLPLLSSRHFEGYASGVSEKEAARLRDKTVIENYIGKTLPTIPGYVQYILNQLRDPKKTVGFRKEVDIYVNSLEKRHESALKNYNSTIRSLLETNNLTNNNLKNAVVSFCNEIFGDIHENFENTSEFNVTDYVLKYYENRVAPILRILHAPFNNNKTIEDSFQSKKE